MDRFKAVVAKCGFHDFDPHPDQSLGFSPITYHEWPALVRLLHREWFQRMWVLQEATVRQYSLYPSSNPAERTLTLKKLDGT
jgi:hypothetical protein